MFKSIIAFCITRRAIVIFILLLFIGAGLAAFKKLNIEAYPNPTPVILEITAQSPGLPAEEMERYYTRPIEIGLYTIPGIDYISSTSFYGLSFVRIHFKYGVDFHFAYAQTAIALQQNVSLPGGVTPNIQQNATTGEIIRYQVVGPPHFGLTNLRTVQDWIIARRLKTIPGIVQVNSWGGPIKEFEVSVDPIKLELYNLSLSQVLNALGNANLNVGGREIHLGQQSVNIRGIGLINSGGDDDLTQGYKVDDIENVVLTQQNSIPVLIKDVAKVSVGYVPRLGIWGRDQEDDAVSGIVVMSRTEKTNIILPKVKDEIEKINHDGSLPPGVKIIPFYDRSTLMGVTTHTVLHNLIFGCLLVFFIQWIFLGDLRSAIIVGLNIPFALLFAIILLVWRNESANLLSLGAVDFGIIIDAAVILVENIFQNFQRPLKEQQALIQHLAEGTWGSDPTTTSHVSPIGSWTDRLRLILISALQVDRAVFFSVMITVIAFLPLFTMQGVEGAIFGPMARTYAFALVGALIATFTVTPVLAALLLPKYVKETETVIVQWLHRIYHPALRFVLYQRKVAITFGVASLVLAGVLIPHLGSEFLPALEEGNFWIRATLPMTLSLEDGEAAVQKMRKILLSYPEVITVATYHGRPDDGSDPSPFSNVELFVPLKPFNEWPTGMTKEKLTNIIDTRFNQELPGVEFNFSQAIQDNIQEAMSGVKAGNSIKIFGPNLEILTQLAEQVRDTIKPIRGIADPGIFTILGQPNLDIQINRTRAARYGLNTGDVTSVIRAAIGGALATTVYESDRQFDVVVRYDKSYRNSIDAIKHIKVAYPIKDGKNAYIPLSELANISLDTGASIIYHENNERFIPVKFSIRGRDLGSTVAEAKTRISQNVKLPTGYRMVWAGEFDQLQEANQRLLVIVPITLVLIIALLYMIFNRLQQCLWALLGIPFATAGGIIALFIAGLHFSVSAAIGFISLFGVSVMNGVLLISYFDHAYGLGASPHEAMFLAGSKIMRPLLMASLSACIGLLPAALSTDIGSEVQRPLATVVVGGMILGPIMLLLIVPPIMVCLHKDRQARDHS